VRRRLRRVGGRALALACAVLAGAPAARAAGLEVTVTSPSGEPVRDAVVYAVPLGADGRPKPAPARAEIDQIDKEYVPYVTAVRVGTAVSFPNRDQIRHHVYSFSDAKSFEIPLYKGEPPEPVLFDKPGVVVLGCNIHDWMKAYVFVTEAQHFAVTDEAGRAALGGLPAGDFAVEVWHPELKGEPEATRQRVALDGGAAALTLAIDRQREFRPRRAPSAGRGGYR
jgi:plastocyanin